MVLPEETQVGERRRSGRVSFKGVKDFFCAAEILADELCESHCQEEQNLFAIVDVAKSGKFEVENHVLVMLRGANNTNY